MNTVEEILYGPTPARVSTQADLSKTVITDTNVTEYYNHFAELYKVEVPKHEEYLIGGTRIGGKCVAYISEGQLHRDDGPAIEYADGGRYWYYRGKHHRDNAPAVIEENGCEAWYQHGQLHRDDGPAETNAAGDRMWIQYDKVHREDGPAIERGDGVSEWYYKDRRHREGGPAFERPDGKQAWYRHHLLHREDGPAVVHANGSEEFWLDGREYTRESWTALCAPSSK